MLFWADNRWQNIEDSVHDVSVSTWGQAAEFAQRDSAGDKDTLYLCPDLLMHTNSEHTVNSK